MGAKALGVIFILVGVGIGFIVLRWTIKALQSNSWPVTMGKLTWSGWGTVEAQPWMNDWGSMGEVDFSYEYKVDGRTYAATRVTFSDKINKTGKSLNALVERFANQSTVMVHYNPRKPAESVLVPGASAYNFTVLITPIGFIVCGVALLIYF